MKKIFTLAIQAAISLIPLAYLYFLWEKLPDTVPMHYNANFEADRFGSKAELIWLLIFMSLVTVGVSALMLFIKKVDPKNKFSDSNPLLVKFSWALVVFLTALSVLIVYQTSVYGNKEASVFSGKIMFGLIGLLFSVLGNIMNNLKPNYFIGIRTPWTLESEQNWRKTHHLTSRVWFVGGVLIFLAVVFLPQEFASIIFTGTMILMVAVPLVYSFLIFKTGKE